MMPGAYVSGAEDGTRLAWHQNSEASLREALAEWAHVHGWQVKQEVVIPEWGRLDLLIASGPTRVAVELKLDLSKPAKARRAFQQADGYRRWLESQNVSADVVLCAPDTDFPHVAQMDLMYQGVECLSVGELMGYLDLHFETLLERRNTVMDRLLTSEHETKNLRDALAALNAVIVVGEAADDIAAELEAEL